MPYWPDHIYSIISMSFDFANGVMNFSLITNFEVLMFHILIDHFDLAGFIKLVTNLPPLVFQLYVGIPKLTITI